MNEDNLDRIIRTVIEHLNINGKTDFSDLIDNPESLKEDLRSIL